MRSWLGWSLLALQALSCGGGGSGPSASVASVSLSLSAATLVPALTLQLTATPKDASGAALTTTVTWASSAATVATVSSSGLVTAATTGVATISATSGGQTGTATITVKDGAVIGAAGGTATALGGNLTVIVPAGALSQATTLTIEPGSALPASTLLIAGTAFELGPSGTQFSQPVTLRFKYLPGNLTGGIPGGGLRVYYVSQGGWVPLAGGSADTVAHVIQGTTTHFTQFASFGPPIMVVPEAVESQGFFDVPNAIQELDGNFPPFSWYLEAKVFDPALQGLPITFTSDDPTVATPESLGSGAFRINAKKMGPPRFTSGRGRRKSRSGW